MHAADAARKHGSTQAPAPRLKRFARHLATDHYSVRRKFPRDALARIEAAISAGEKSHAGQVRFVVEAALPLALVLARQTPRERALDVFGRLRIWDTEGNSGVLVYLLLADRRVEIVADRGIDRVVGDAEWHSICRSMESAFRERRFAERMGEHRGPRGALGEATELQEAEVGIGSVREPCEHDGEQLLHDP